MEVEQHHFFRRVARGVKGLGEFVGDVGPKDGVCLGWKGFGELAVALFAIALAVAELLHAGEAPDVDVAGLGHCDGFDEGVAGDRAGGEGVP